MQDHSEPQNPAVTLRAVVAVPARNEAARIAACLSAFEGQVGVGSGAFGVLLLVNNASDGTAALARELSGRLPYPLRVSEIDLPPERAHAGWARRLAMDEAGSWLDEAGHADGVILTTDADSRVAADWVATTLAAFDAGADAVAGLVTLDAEEAARLPPALRLRSALEDEYEGLLAELQACLDPEVHDPWPRHAMASGASLAVTLGAYRSVGGLPPVPLGEDRALVAALLSRDARVRHPLDVRVVTSGRLDGRAAGGAADTLRARGQVPDEPCDEKLEPAVRAAARAICRARLRRAWVGGTLAADGPWASRLGLPAARALEIAALPAFGQVWASVAASSPALVARRLRPSDLLREIGEARRIIGLVRVIQARGARDDQARVSTSRR